MNPLIRIFRMLGGELGDPQPEQQKPDPMADMLARQRAFEQAQAADAQRRMAQQPGQPGEVGWNGVVDPQQIIGYLTGRQ